MKYRNGRPDLNIALKQLNDSDRTFRPHWHMFFELEFILSGDGTQTINGNSYKMRRGEIHILRPTDIHEFDWSVAPKLYLIQFEKNHVSESLYKRLSALKSDPITYLTEDDFHLCEACCISLDKIKEHSDPTSLDKIRRMLDLVLSVFLGNAESKPSEARHSGKTDSLTPEIVGYIRENYCHPITADEIARHFGFNTNYFRRLFRRSFGFGIADYLKLLRLELAKNLLIGTNAKVYDVMIECGYNSTSSFARDFRERYGFTPTELRQGYEG